MGNAKLLVFILTYNEKDNIEKIMEEIRKSLPPKAQIKNIYLKLTMSKPVKLEV